MVSKGQGVCGPNFCGQGSLQGGWGGRVVGAGTGTYIAQQQVGGEEEEVGLGEKAMTWQGCAWLLLNRQNKCPPNPVCPFHAVSVRSPEASS